MATASSHTDLTLVSYNVAGCQPSKVAPSKWTQFDSLTAIEKEILQNERKPDIVALQEFPSFALDRKRILSEYNLIGYQASHAPYVALFVHQKWNAEKVHQDMNGLPAIVAEIDLSSTDDTNHSTTTSNMNQPRRRVWIASVHLEPFADGASRRKRQMESLVSQATAEKVPLIIAGDTNMRVAEDKGIENDLGLHDFWKLAGGEARTKFTVSPVERGSTFFPFCRNNSVVPLGVLVVEY
jgi:endonuclease/exonuclease/phosphatase family metal-dependent hydrolase